ncbi:MAG: hypothetical protein CVU09_01085 [Bacteroidetes bacterium HGW-Bacteroidetes-4]|nr:MAG: hypothetical protein CVU09_01085 [Bacteroidetes bacterium HGW-Bacteroidetes-4]
MLLLVAAAASIFWLYFKNNNNGLDKSKRYFLATLRSLSLLLVIFLLMLPVLHTLKRYKQQPILLIAVDNSQSMISSSDSLFVNDTLPMLLKKQVNPLTAFFDVDWLQFGEKTDSLQFTFTDRETNFEELFQYIKTRYYQKPIGALLLISDGIYNRGEQPLYMAHQANFPIYTLALGDTLPQKDFAIRQLDYNKLVYQGTSFPVFVNIEAFDAAGNQAELLLKKKGKVIQKKTLQVNEKFFFEKVAFQIAADSLGIHEYDLVLQSNLPNEPEANNERKLVVEVSDKTKEVLLLYHSLHPDLAIINRVMQKNQVFKLTMARADAIPDSIEPYQLVILHQLPSANYNLNQFYEKLQKQNKPLLYILGAQTQINAFNKLNSDFKITQTKALLNEVQAIENPRFSKFTTSINAELLSKLPPLQVPFGDYGETEASQTLFFQKIGSVATQKPLWFFTETGPVKNGFILGEGIWQWSIQEYLKMENHSFTQELISKTILYLTSDTRKSWIELEIPLTHYQHIPLKLNAHLYNPLGELITEPELQLELVNEQNHKFSYVFHKNNQTYSLNMGTLPNGNYRYKVSAQIGDEPKQKNGRFFVMESNLEQINLQANHQLLYNLAEQQGGSMKNRNQIDKLITDIEANNQIKPTFMESKGFKSLLEFKVLFFVLFLFWALEWFFRKYWGSI